MAAIDLQNSSEARAKICAMKADAITAALWALSGFDPALVHFAELREHTNKLPEEHQLRISLDRALSVYVEGQCRELLVGAAITTDAANLLVEQEIGDPADVAFYVLACTDDPLGMEIFGYALWLGVLTSHGLAPWNRYKSVMADCFTAHHRSVVHA